MPNPNGPYPGRQLFLGATAANEPCLVYLVTGRSPESRQRKAAPVDTTVRMGPIDDSPYDPLRHYTALKYENSSGVAAITNGIQTEAIFETYTLLFNVGTSADKDYLEKLMEGANSEPDTLHTPRIGGVIIAGKGTPAFILGIKTHNVPAAAYQVVPAPGRLAGISTYQGSLDSPQPTPVNGRLSWIEFSGKTPQELAKYLYDLSAADYKGDDIRVCAVSAVYSGDKWNTAIINKYY